MEVYFHKNGKKFAGKPLRRISVGKNFVGDGKTGFLPAVYWGEEGLAADFCICIPAEQIEQFAKKWGTRTPEMTKAEQEEWMYADPFYGMMRAEARADGKKLRLLRCESVCWRPAEMHSGAVDTEAELWMKEYSCAPDCGWKFVRMWFAWGDASCEASGMLQFVLRAEPKPVTGAHFVTETGCVGKQVELVHPVTGRRHVLTVHDCRQERIDWEEIHARLRKSFQERKEQFRDICMTMERRTALWENTENPDWYQVLSYLIEPPLPRTEIFLRDCADGDRPVKKAGSGSAEVTARGIAVIGGKSAKRKKAETAVSGAAAGPTSVFIADRVSDTGRRQVSEASYEQAYSSLHFVPAEQVEWRVEFQVANENEVQIDFQLQEEGKDEKTDN